jgi:hypothetical protein
MKLSELCAMLKSYIADNETVANYEIGHADFGAVNQSSIVLNDDKEQIVFDANTGDSEILVARLLEYEEDYANYDVCHVEFGSLTESDRVELNEQLKMIIIC